jgi:DNA-binding phage protein
VSPEKVAAARDLIAAGHSVARAAAAVGLGRSTLYREIQENAR